MRQAGKSSSKRSQPSYFMAILGVSLVLFILGILGWIVINANKLGDYFKRTWKYACIYAKTFPVKTAVRL